MIDQVGGLKLNCYDIRGVGGGDFEAPALWGHLRGDKTKKEKRKENGNEKKGRENKGKEGKRKKEKKIIWLMGAKH